MENPAFCAENSQMVSFSDRSEIAFFDVETSVPTRPGQGYAILEFGAILVCPRKLIELESYSTLLQPSDLSLISNLSVRCNGITRDAVVSAPTFGEIADKVYDILHGRIWAGHNILRFDCYRIREAFAGINRPAPEPKGTIDSLALLTQRFGRRAGDMKMATLASYFGIGQQTHRSLDDVRMNLEVLKYCATVLFLESSLPNIFTENSWVSPNATTRSRSNGRTSLEEMSFDSKRAPSTSKVEDHATSAPLNHIEEAHPIFSLVTPMSNVNNTPGTVESCFAGTEPLDMGQMAGEMERQPLGSEDSMEEEESGTAYAESCVATAENDSREEEAHPILSLVTSMMSTNTPDIVESNFSRPDAFDMGLLTSEMERQPIQSEPLQSEDSMEEEKSVLVSREYSVTTSSEGSTGRVNFLAPYEISLPSISVILAPFYRGTQKIQILHNSVALQVCCRQLKVRFGISTKFVNKAGHPRLSFVVDASSSLCRILDKIDSLAQQLSVDSGSSSEWRPCVTRKAGFFNFPTVRLHLPTIMDGDTLRWAAEIYQEESSTTQRLVFSKFDIIELDSLFTPGNSLDAYFSLDAYDYHQNAGIRLVAKKLILHPN